MQIIDINDLINGGKHIYDKMNVNQYSIDHSWENCHSAFLKIKGKYANPATDMTPEEMDFLCLSLAWYLASWGMLRNSFLNEYSHKIHIEAIRVIYDHRWDSLWDVDYLSLTESQANLIVELASNLEATYTRIHQFPREDYELTDTLKTKILLGTIACVPAYDRFFKCALKCSFGEYNFGKKSILELKQVYTDYARDFANMKAYCGNGSYPSAKLLDMCFFEYGVKLSKIEEKAKVAIPANINSFNPRSKEGRDIKKFICLYAYHGNSALNNNTLFAIYSKCSATYDAIRQAII